MASSRILEVVLTGKDDGALALMGKLRDSTEQTEDRTKRMGERFQVAGGLMLGAAATIGAGMYAAGKSAAALEQAVGGTEAVFEGSSSTIDAWAKGAATSAGLSEEAARRLSTRLGGALQGLGYDQAEAAKQAVSLTQLGGDLAATYGGETSEAVEALGSAFRGEFDPLEQFNIFLKQSEVDAKAVSMGLAKNTNDVDKNARAQATLAMVMEQSSAAQGQFGRESNTTSGQMAIAAAQAENAKAALGEGFMPVMTKAAGIAGGLASKFSEMNAESNGATSSIASWGVVALGAAGGVSMLVGTTMKMKDNLSALASGASNAASSLGTMGGAIRGVSFTAAATGVVLLTKKLQDNADEAKKWADSVTGGASGTLPERIARVTTELDKQQKILEGYKSVDVLGQHLFGSNEGRIQSSKVEALRAELDMLKGSEDEAKASAELTSRGVDQLGKSVSDSTDKVSDANKAWDEAKKVLSDYFDEAAGQVDKERAVAETADKFAQTLAENNKKLFGAWKVGTQEGRDNQKAFQDAAQAALALGLANEQAGVNVGQNSQAVNDQIAKLREQAIRYGLNGQEVDAYLAKLHLTPEQVTTMFNAPGLAEARAEAERLNNAIGSAASRINSLANSGKGGGTLFGSSINLGYRAAGGPVDAGRPYIVGEKGPELMVPGSSGSIVNNDQLGRMSAAGGNVYNFNFAGHLVSDRDLGTLVQRAMLELQRVSATPVLPGVSG